MPLFVLERSFDAPQDINHWRQSESPLAFEKHNVREIRTYLARDRLRMLTLYEAQTRDSVEAANVASNLPYSKIWGAGKFRELMGMPAFDDQRGRETVVCERDYGQEVPLELIAKMSQAAGECLELANCDLIESYVPTPNAGSICVFAAPDAESVRRANRTANLPFTSVWAATVHTPQ